MIRQKSWFQLVLGTAIAAFLLPLADANKSWHSNSNPWIEKALKSHGIMTDTALQQHISPLEYPIFGGKSALHSLSDSCRQMIRRELCSDDDNNNDNINKHNKHNKAKVALLLILAGHGDAAHDVLLGTTLDNLEEAEFAATHRGQTNWAQDHSLSDLDDVLHSIIHRIYEGAKLGEGGYSGYDNAQFWCAGGPKQYEQPINSMVAKKDARTSTSTTAVLAKVYQELCQAALQKTPICVSKGIIASQASPPEEAAAAASSSSSSPRRDEKRKSNETTRRIGGRGGGVTHSIIAGGGKYRDVFVPNNCWDPIAFCELLLVGNTNHSATKHQQQYDDLQQPRQEQQQQQQQQELDYLTEKELELLAKHLLLS